MVSLSFVCLPVFTMDEDIVTSNTYLLLGVIVTVVGSREEQVKPTSGSIRI